MFACNKRWYFYGHFGVHPRKSRPQVSGYFSHNIIIQVYCELRPIFLASATVRSRTVYSLVVAAAILCVVLVFLSSSKRPVPVL